MLASEGLTGALLDRLTHHVSIVTMNGDSYRLKQSFGRRCGALTEQKQATQTVDPATDEITPRVTSEQDAVALSLACIYSAPVAWKPTGVDSSRRPVLPAYAGTCPFPPNRSHRL